MISNRAFLGWVVLAGLAVFCAPVTPLTPVMLQAAAAAPAVVMTGTSVIRHASKCDVDSRTIPAMLAAASGNAVLDLSFSGQSFADSVNLAAISLRNPRVQTVLLTVSLFALMEADMVSLRDYAAFRLLNPFLPAEPLSHRLARSEQSGLYGPMQDGFTYGGSVYPAYDQLKTRFLQPERDAAVCPETDGQNRAFMTALYDHTYLHYPILSANVALVAGLQQAARQRGKALTVVLLPIDVALMQALLPAEAAQVHAHVQALVRQLSEAGAAVVDLTEAVPNDGFADRWCACGHLLAAGRRIVAERLTADLASPVTAARH